MSPPGNRFSIRSDFGLPITLRSASAPTTRSAQVRLSTPHAIAVGANEPGWNRL